MIFISQLGSVAWYPATGLVLALMLGISPWYAVLVCFADALAGVLIYHQTLLSFGETVGVCRYCGFVTASAAYILRGPLRIDLGLRRRQDVVRYVFVTMSAAAVSYYDRRYVPGSLTSRSPWSEFWTSPRGWFFGDGIGLRWASPHFF